MDKGSYKPVIAEARHLEARRNQRPCLKMTDEAWHSIKGQLEKRCPPEEVVKKNILAMLCRVKPSTITFFSHERGIEKAGFERFVASGENAEREKNGEGRGKIPEMTRIDSRPAEINAREVPGHWEGDLIIGKSHKSAILVTVERQSRFVQMDLLESMDARTVGSG
jgi:IS30 family transposase